MLKLIISYCLILIIIINYTSARLAPSYMTPCPGRKADCLKKTVQETLPLFAKGIPELGIESIDPLRQSHVGLTLPGALKIELNNGTMTGLRKCNINSVTFNNDDADLKMHCDLIIKGQYKANGRILIVTINGNGNAKIKIKNTFVHAKIKFADKIRDGITYYEVKDFNAAVTNGDKVTFDLTNLFEGSPELSEAVLQFLNQNWKQIADEFGKPLVDKLVDIIYKIVKKFFEVVPKNELFVD